METLAWFVDRSQSAAANMSNCPWRIFILRLMLFHQYVSVCEFSWLSLWHQWIHGCEWDFSGPLAIIWSSFAAFARFSLVNNVRSRSWEMCSSSDCHWAPDQRPERRKQQKEVRSVALLLARLALNVIAGCFLFFIPGEFLCSECWWVWCGAPRGVDKHAHTWSLRGWLTWSLRSHTVQYIILFGSLTHSYFSVCNYTNRAKKKKN